MQGKWKGNAVKGMNLRERTSQRLNKRERKKRGGLPAVDRRCGVAWMMAYGVVCHHLSHGPAGDAAPGCSKMGKMTCKVSKAAGKSVSRSGHCVLGVQQCCVRV